MKAYFSTITFVFAILIQGCTSPSINQAETDSNFTGKFSRTGTPEQLIAKAIVTKEPHARATLYLDAATLYWQSNLAAQTSAALLSIKPEYLDHKQLQYFLLINLKLGIAENNTARLERTLPLLVNKPLYQTSIEGQVEFIELMANAYRMTGRHLKAAIILAENTGLFMPERHPEINEAIWLELQHADINELVQVNYTGDNYDAEGWLALALTIRQNQINLEQQYQALNAWKDTWPAHPAVSQQPHELEILSQLPNSRPNSIILALPLSGPLSEVGIAVRDGFMASYYNANSPPPATESKQNTLSAVEEELHIHYFDTHENDIEQLYENEPSPNSLIIGPLDKESLQKLATFDALNTKTLALNHLENQSHTISNLFQFGLAPEAETHQIVQRIIQHNLKKIAIIAPETNWGFRVHDAFYSALSANNGVLIESAYYSNQASLSETVAMLLATDSSKKRARQVQSISGTKLEFLPRRREDIDAIFMVAQAETARQLNPLFAFHYAKDIPVFATSQIHSPTPSIKDDDLSQIEFVEMPWMLSSANGIKNQLHKLIPESSERYNRFYALGADAFNLAPRLKLLREIKGSQIQGQTGVLSMNQEGIVNRKMQWAKFVNGKAIAIQE